MGGGNEKLQQYIVIQSTAMLCKIVIYLNLIGLHYVHLHI